MPKITPRTPLILVIACSFLAVGAVRAAGSDSTKSQFNFKDANGKTQSIPVVSNYYRRRSSIPWRKWTMGSIRS